MDDTNDIHILLFTRTLKAFHFLKVTHENLEGKLDCWVREKTCCKLNESGIFLKRIKIVVLLFVTK
jgi:hypothetical protein